MTTPNDPRYPGSGGQPPSEDPTQRFGGTPNLDKTQQHRPTEQYPVDEQYGQQPYGGQRYGDQQYGGQPYGGQPPYGQTEQFPDGGYHTSDPDAAYGANHPNDTQAYPPAYDGGYPPNRYPPNQWGEVPPLEQQRPPGSSKTGMWIALAAVVVLVAAIGVGAFLLLRNSGGDDETSVAAATTTSSSTGRTTTPRPSTEATLTPEFTIPDIPLPTDILDDIGLVSGTITAIDGDTITIEPSLGNVTKITTTNSTFVLTTSGTSISDLAVGQEITAQGDVTGDTLAAQFITDITIGIPN